MKRVAISISILILIILSASIHSIFLENFTETCVEKLEGSLTLFKDGNLKEAKKEISELNEYYSSQKRILLISIDDQKLDSIENGIFRLQIIAETYDIAEFLISYNQTKYELQNLNDENKINLGNLL